VNYSELITAVSDYTENTFSDVDMATFVQQAEQRIFNTVQFPALRKNMTGTTTWNTQYLSTPDDFLSAYSLAVIDGSGNYEFLLNKDVNFIRQTYPSANTRGIPKYYAIFGPTTTSDVVPAITNEISLLLGPTPDDAYTVELHFYYYPDSIVRGRIKTLAGIVGGSGYSNGTYYDVPLTGGTGSGAKATITVAGGAVTTVTITNRGVGYATSDTLSAGTTIGASGVGFYVPVNTIYNQNGTSWLGDNFDSVLLYGTLMEAYTYMKGEQDMLQLYSNRYLEALQLAKRLGDGLDRMDAYRSGQARVGVK
jgi:hypothetical protein